MPYVSQAQQRYFNANREKLEAQDVDEYNQASKGMHLPKRKGPPKDATSKQKEAVRNIAQARFGKGSSGVPGGGTVGGGT
jgi:hypothetical protein